VPEPEARSARAEQRRRTEARILAAASRLFVDNGYERTTIRGIAHAAGVDAGLVMHYFGSKRELFRRVTQAGRVPELSGTAEQVTEQILAMIAESLADEPVQSLALLRSMLTHPEAAQAWREATEHYHAEISRPIAAADASVRAALVLAVILGVIVSRHLLRSPGLSDAGPQEVADLLRPCLRSLARADAPEAGEVAEPIPVRRAARVMLLDPDDRVLLMRYDDGPPNGRHWTTPGGGLEHGEQYPAAALRELAEETGWTDVTLLGEVYRRSFAMEYAGQIVNQVERQYLARTDQRRREIRGVEAMHAADGIAAWRWWSLDELEATQEDIWPANLVGLLRSSIDSGQRE
jgi:AcrR family transcriptional regulator